MNNKPSMGRLTSEDMSQQIEKIKHKITSNNKDPQKIKSMTELNNKLTDSYSVSLKIIVDVSKLLNQYMVFFNEIDKVLIESDKHESNTNTLNSEYLQYINKLTSENIQNMTNDFEKQLESMIPIYKKNNIPTTDLDNYNILIKDIKQESQSIATQTGGKRKKKKKPK